MRSNILKNISGDKKLNLFQHIYWVIVAYLNIKIENHKISDKINIFNFKPKKKITFMRKMRLTPSRYWCNLFWQDLPFDLIFNRGFKALEIGCGSGTYGKFLENQVGFKNYTGIDIVKRWKIQNRKFKFFQDSFKNIDRYLKKINFIITQSALEHFDEDLDLHLKIGKYIKKNKYKKKFFQLHLIPSEQCLFTYLGHGYRHYSIRSISKICAHYSKNKTKFILFKLGSDQSNKLHLRYITLPKFFPKFTSRYDEINYSQKLDKAIKHDAKKTINNKPSFYALMILNNYKKSDIEKIINYYK